MPASSTSSTRRPCISTKSRRVAPGTTVLATNAMSEVQSAEIRTNGSVAWAVQYHPEYPLREVAAIVRRIGTRLIEEGLLRRRGRHQDLRAGSRHARPRSGLQAAGLAPRHQQERARQEAARQRGRQLDRIPGAAERGGVKRGRGIGSCAMDFSGKHVVVTGGTGALGSAVVGALLAAGASCTLSLTSTRRRRSVFHAPIRRYKLIAVAGKISPTKPTSQKFTTGFGTPGPRSTSPAALRRARSRTPTRPR